MREFTTYLELEGDVLADIDVLTDDSYIGVTGKGRVVFPFNAIEIKQTFKFPIIRQLSDDLFLIADSRTNSEESDNCFDYDLKGNAVRHFYAGDGIQDIEVLRGKIVVTYFDEGVLGTDGPNNYGLVVFDFDGNILSKYNEKHGDQIILDCYCICKHGVNRILFLPYAEFALIELNVDTWGETKYEIPEQLKGSSGLTSNSAGVIFYSPYNDKRGIYRWRPGDKKAEKIGEYSEGLRGLKNGRFISVGQKGFTIIDLN